MNQTSTTKLRVAAPVHRARAPDRLASVRHNKSWLIAGTTGAVLAGAAVFNALGAVCI